MAQMEARLESADEGRAKNAGANEYSVCSEDALRAARDVPAHELVPAFVGRVLRRPSLHARNKGPAGASVSTCRSATRARSPPRFQSLCICPLPPSRQSPSVCRAPHRRRPCRGGRCLAGTSHATGRGPRMPARKRKPVKLCTRVPFGDQARCKLGLYISRW